MPYFSLNSGFLWMTQNKTTKTKLRAKDARKIDRSTDFEILDSRAGKIAGPIIEATHITIIVADTASPSAALVAIDSLTFSPKLIECPIFVLMPNA